MKFYLLNKEAVKEDIWTNPILIKTKCASKINKIRTLQKKLNTLLNTVKKELYNDNAGLNEEKIEQLIQGDGLTEVSRQEYNSLLVMSLFDTQEQRIKCCNKTEVLKGKLYGNTIK